MIKIRYLKAANLTQIIISGDKTSTCFFYRGATSEYRNITLEELINPDELSCAELNVALTSPTKFTITKR